MSKLRNNMIWQILYQGLAILIPLVTSPYLSRVLGAEGLGVYSYNYSVVSYFMLIALLGVSTYGMRTISQSKNKEEVSKNFFGIYYFQLISSAIALTLYLVFVTLFVKEEINRIVSFVHALYLVGECVNINWLFFGLEKYKTTVLRNIIIRILTLASVFIFVKKESDVVIYVLILALGNVLSNLILWLKIRGCISRVSISWADIKGHIKPNIVLFIPVLASSVYHIMDKTMLGVFSDSSNSGYYYNADKLLNIPLTLITASSTVFMTRVCALYKNNNAKKITKTQNESIFFGMCIICAVAFGICGVANEFIPWFFGNGYEPCIELVKYFAVIVILKTISTHTRSVFLIPEKNDKSYAKSIAIGAVINFVANVVFIYALKLGALGATIGTLIAEALVVLLQIAFMKNLSSKKICLNGILQSVVYILMGAVMLLLLELIPLNVDNGVAKLFAKIAIGAFVYLVECAILWKFTPAFMPDMIRDTLRQIKNKVTKR